MEQKLQGLRSSLRRPEGKAVVVQEGDAPMCKFRGGHL